MKKQDLMKWILGFLFVFVVSMQTAEARKREVQRGMTKQEVQAILGKPHFVSFNEQMDRWEYVQRKNVSLTNFSVKIIIDFDHNDRVITCQTVEINMPPRTAPDYSHSYPSDYGRGRFYDDRTGMLSSEKFNILYNKVKNTGFDDRKMDLIEVAALSSYFSGAQCARLLSLFTFSEAKLSCLRFLAHRIVDPHNTHDIYMQFTFASDKDKVSAILQGR